MSFSDYAHWVHKSVHNIDPTMMSMDVVGAAGAAGLAWLSNKKRKRSNTSSTKDTTNVPFSQQQNVAKYMAAGTEYGDGRRAAAFVKRLHDAKYLKCDALLKELFFPTLTQCRRFGFCSTSGIFPRDGHGGSSNSVGGAAQYQASGADYPVTNSKAAGLYRGIAMFTLRSQALSHSAYSKLNEVPQTMGLTMITGSSSQFSSAFRRFNSRPDTNDDDGNASAILGNYAPSVTNQMFGTTSTDVLDANKLFVSEVGDINIIETKAVQSTNFQHAIGSSTSSEGTTSMGVESGATSGTNWDGSGSVVGDNGRYYANLKNTTIRIADGYLEMDVTNGKTTSTFIELVIHAHKKHDASISTQELVNAIYSSVQYQQSDRNVSPYYSNASSQQNPGGWQAFWDPTYPFLACKSQHRKPIDAIAKEVHRSCHMLGPGQSKLIKIHLGALYYDIGNKSTSNVGEGDSNTPFSFDNPATGVGALNISIGHSGVQSLSAPVDPLGGLTGDQFSVYPDEFDATTEAHNVSGGGFWVGKAPCPSEIVVSGRYCEKFYPAYVVDKERRNWSDRPMLPPSVGSRALPTALPVTNTVGVDDISRHGVTASVTSQNNAAGS